MSWSPWIVNPGTGYPGFDKGTRLLVELRDPAQGMALVDLVECCVGEGPRINEEKDWMMDGQWDGESWRLPCAEGFLYISRYKVWRDLQELFGIQGLDTKLARGPEPIRSPWQKTKERVGL